MSEVRQDHRGRLYRVVYFDNKITGQRTSVNLPYAPSPDAPVARTIPVAEEPKPKLRRRQAKTGPDARRLMVIHYRRQGDKKTSELIQPNKEGQRMVDEGIRSFLRSPDCGKTWVPVFGNEYDHFFQYHIDEEIK